MTITRWSPFGFFTALNINTPKLETNTSYTSDHENYRSTLRRITMQTAGQTVQTTGTTDLEIENPLRETQALSHHIHTGQSYIEAAGSLVNAYIFEQTNSYSIIDQNNTSATIKQPSITSYVNGMVISALFSIANTGASTLAIKYTTASATSPIVYSQATLPALPIYKQNINNYTYSIVDSGDLLGNVTLKYLSIVPGIGTAGFIVLQSNTTAFNYLKLFNIRPYSTFAGDMALNQASFITKVNDTTISFTFGTPIKVCFPEGTIQTYSNATDLPNIINIVANGTYTIVKELNQIQPIATLNAVTESAIPPITPVDGDYWLDIRSSILVPYKRVGGVWVVTQFVKLGQFTKTGGVIGTVTTYSFNRIVRPIPITMVASPTGYIQFHNLGYNGTNVKGNVYATCINPTSGFGVGDSILLTHSENNGASVGYNTTATYTKLQVATYILNNCNIINPSGSYFNLSVIGPGNFTIGWVLDTTF